MAQWNERRPANQKVTSLIPGQGKCLGCRPGPRLGAREEKPIHVPLTFSQLETWPATQACALTGNQTGDLLVRRLVLNPLSHTSQGSNHIPEGKASGCESHCGSGLPSAKMVALLVSDLC